MEIITFQKQGMGVIYGTGIEKIDDYIGGFVFLERLPSYDRPDDGREHGRFNDYELCEDPTRLRQTGHPDARGSGNQ